MQFSAKFDDKNGVSDVASLQDIGFYICLIGVAYTLLLHTNFTPLSMILAFFMVAKGQNGLMSSGHEAVHGTLFKNKKTNDFIGTYLGHALMGIGFHRTRATHIEHHVHTLTERDEELDRYLENPTRKEFLKLLFFPLFGGYFINGMRKILGYDRKKRAKPQYKISPAKRRSDTFSIILSSIILCTILTYIDWRLYFFFWIAPLFTITTFFLNARSFLDHSKLPGEAEGLFYNYKISILDRMFFPTTQVIHAGHHLYPFVPYHQLPKMLPALYERSDVRERSGYFASLIQYVKRIEEFNDLTLLRPMNNKSCDAESSMKKQ